MTGIPDNGRHDEMVRRLTAGLRGAGDDGGVNIDAESIARVGAFKVRRRRSFTAAGVAGGVVVLVVGGTIIARQPPTTVRSAGSVPVPVCVSSTTTPTLSWGWDGASPADEGSLALSTMNSPSMTMVARSSEVPGARSAAESSAAKEAASAASAAASAAAEVPIAPSGMTWVSVGSGSSVLRPDWYSTPKRFQLTAALRAAIPSQVKVLKGTTNWLEFGDSASIGTAFTIVLPDPSGVNSASPDATPASTMAEYAIPDPAGPGFVSAYGTVFKPDLGWGDLTVDVSKGNADPPTCSNGKIQRRITEADGMVVDIGVVATAPNPSGQGSALRVTAYRPDGTVVTAEATTTGTAKQMPMTAEELMTVATAPGLDVTTAPDAVDSSSAALLTTDQNGAVLTLTKPTPPPVSTTQAAPTR